MKALEKTRIFFSFGSYIIWLLEVEIPVPANFTIII